MNAKQDPLAGGWELAAKGDEDAVPAIFDLVLGFHG
jgi:hypothetical protein